MLLMPVKVSWGDDGSLAVSTAGAAQSLFCNGSTADQSMLNENGDASQDPGMASTEPIHEDASVPAFSAEEEKLWSIVRANSLDFDAWVALIEETEKGGEGNILKMRRSYDAFLAEFPLSYGYWKKYAEHEALGSTEKAIEVYERAVLGVTYSVDIWLHYCRFSITKYEEPEVIRRLFQRGLAYVGTDYLSHSLWDEYIEYEYKQQQWCRLAVIYAKIFETPILYLNKYWNSFKELAANRPLSELRTVEEAAKAEDDVQKDRDTGKGSAEDTEQTLKPKTDGLTEAQQLEKFIAIREETYKKSKEFDSKILGFETAIGRPYFHVKPLHVAELENWHNYLNFIESEGDFTKGNINNALAIYEQAIAVEKGKEHSQALPVLFVQYARFLYLVPGKLEKAREILVEASEPVQLSKPFLEAMICLETVLPFPKRIKFLDTLIEKFLTSNMDGFNSVSFAEREELSNIFLEFLDLVGEANNIRKAHNRHIRLFLHGRANSHGKKRNTEDFLQSDKAKLMKSDALVSSTTPPMGTYPNIQGQWAAGYGLQQTWPHVTQTPVQRWNPGYGLTDGYLWRIQH